MSPGATTNGENVFSIQGGHMPESNPGKPGNTTSEFKLSGLVAILGALLAGATVMLGALQDAFPTAGWIGVAAGVVAMAASVLGFAKSRSTVKAADIMATAAKVIAGVSGPAAGMAVLKSGEEKSVLPP